MTDGRGAHRTRRVTRPRSTNTDHGECAMSMPSMKPRGPSARLRDRRFYQAIRPPRWDPAGPGTPADPTVELTGARRAVDRPFPPPRIFHEDPTGHGLARHGPRPG